MKKLKNLPNKESHENYTFRLRESHAALLEQYRSYASEKYEVELSMPELLKALVTTAIDDDKDFRNWCKSKNKSRPKPATSLGGSGQPPIASRTL